MRPLKIPDKGAGMDTLKVGMKNTVEWEVTEARTHARGEYKIFSTPSMTRLDREHARTSSSAASQAGTGPGRRVDHGAAHGLDAARQEGARRGGTDRASTGAGSRSRSRSTTTSSRWASPSTTASSSTSTSTSSAEEENRRLSPCPLSCYRRSDSHEHCHRSLRTHRSPRRHADHLAPADHGGRRARAARGRVPARSRTAATR